MKALYGAALPVTITGITAVHNGVTIAMWATYAEAGRVVLTFKAFDEARGILRAHIKTVLRAVRALILRARQYQLPIQSVADTQYPRAAELLEHLGFRHLERNLYQWQT